MQSSDAVVIFITAGSIEESRAIAQVLLDKKKTACVNIVPQVESLFWWQGKVDSERECLLVIKTKASVLDEVIKLVKQVHSYEVAEVIAMPIIGGNEDYLKWVDDEVEE